MTTRVPLLTIVSSPTGWLRTIRWMETRRMLLEMVTMGLKTELHILPIGFLKRGQQCFFSKLLCRIQ